MNFVFQVFGAHRTGLEIERISSHLVRYPTFVSHTHTQQAIKLGSEIEFAAINSFAVSFVFNIELFVALLISRC